MTFRILLLPAALAGSLLSGAAFPDPVPPGAPPPMAREAAVMAEAIAATRQADWDRAMEMAGRVDDPVAREIVVWERLRAEMGDWEEYRDFVADNPDWPGLALVRRNGERRMPAGLGFEEVTAFLGDAPPQTGSGSLRFAEALAAAGREAEADAEVGRAWRELSLTPHEAGRFREDWAVAIAPHHVARLDNLLWRGLTREAEAMLDLVDPGLAKLAEARIAVRRDAEGLMARIASVPGDLKADPGLAFERYLYRVNKGRWDEAEAYLLEMSTDAAVLGRPEMWMERRANLARQVLRRGEVDAAYRLAAKSFGTEGADFADSEWVAGFIALTRQNDPEAAIGHFTRFREVVATPISLGRAGYWLGLAHAAAGDSEAAEAAWAEGAKHQTSFYGQLAAARAGLPADPTLAGGATLPDWRAAPFGDSEPVRAALLLHAAGEEGLVRSFLRHAAEDQPAEIRSGIAQMAIDIGLPHVGIRIAKDAAADGLILTEQYYPLHAIGEASWPVPTEFALAIARQESELNPEAVSPAGARGLMQLMPATAAQVAGQNGLSYDSEKLTGDPLYNATLGTDYLARLLRQFNGSYVLAAAAYNAGPGRVREWLATYGDPRTAEVDAVEWIETIPFSETRNYVMRVLESLHVYRARLSGETEPIRLAQDVEGTG